MTYLLLRLLSLIFIFIPRPVCLAIGRLIGWLFYSFFQKRINVARKNILLMFPKMNIKEREKILYESYKHFGMILMDSIKISNYSVDKIKSLIDSSSTDISDIQNDDGGIIMTAHIGNWEMIIPEMSRSIKKFYIVVKNHKNTSFNKYLDWIRKREHIELITSKAPSKKIIQQLDLGSFIGLASDQNAYNKGIDINIFNSTASLPMGAAKLHIRTKKNIYLVICLLNNNYNYKISIETIQLNTKNSNMHENILTINQLYATRLESYIKSYPHQYFWFHRLLNYKEYNTI